MNITKSTRPRLFGARLSVSDRQSCKDCRVRKFPPCEYGIPCCQCSEDSCNSTQPCPKGGGDD